MNVPYSIIIPCYNAAGFIERTLRSLHEQTYKNFEVVLVDDNSKDESFELAKQFIETSGISGKVLRKPASLGQGVASSRNYALQHASGDYFFFLDCDDIFHPQKIELLHQFFTQHPQVMAVCHPYQSFQDETTVSFQQIDTMEQQAPISLNTLLTGNIIGASTVCVRKSLFESCGLFDVRLNGVEDYLQWMKIASKTDWIFLNQPLTHYRISSTSLMGKRSLSYYVDQNYKLWKASFTALTLSGQQRQQLYQTLFYKTMNYYIGISLNEKGYIDFLQGLKGLFVKGFPMKASHFFFRDLKRRILKRLFKG
jgi:glycosyltransferase involved in cell wall biosynthesis